MKLTLAWAWLGVVGMVFSVTAPRAARADDLIVDGTTVSLSGVREYEHVCVINGGTIDVTGYSGGDKKATGNLELRAASIYVDATSKINARGKGYTTPRCSDGSGPTATAGGRGGCSVMDSGGGGAHFGGGGRGTVDNPTGTGHTWQHNFPTAFEDDCNIDFDTSTSRCKLYAPKVNSSDANTPPPICSSDDDTYGCRTWCWNSTSHPLNGTTRDNPTSCVPSATVSCEGPTVAGKPFWHNIYAPEFGAAGGEKGCRDGDGNGNDRPQTGGAGGGRVVLVGLKSRLAAGKADQAPTQCGGTRLTSGHIRIAGTIDAAGKRGCGDGNDSGGGGAGGTVMIVGDDVVINTTARISAAGGLGGDTRAGATGQPDYLDCPGAQGSSGNNSSATCDDCGGGGGGGIISVLSVTRDLQPGPVAQFNVAGAFGGVCDICKGEAGGGAGELQLDGAYVGEFCDGFDNDFDGKVDEGLPDQTCGLGACQKTIAACSGGVPVSCVPDVSQDDCKSAPRDARPRVAVILDTSASMLLDLKGRFTYGDGSAEHAGLDTSGNAKPDDSRLYLARESLGQVISAYPEIDFALARYHQDQGINRSCQTATWFECQGLAASYDDPTDNSDGSPVLTCSARPGPNPATTGTTRTVKQVPGPNAQSTTECINYAGSCGSPRRGADVLSGFGTPVRDMVRWLDGEVEDFDPSMTTGDVCAHSQGKNCELRGSGPTPLAGSLQAIQDYITPIRTEDSAVDCRGYSVILVTDGAESCNGNPVDAAQKLKAAGVDVSVVALSVLPTETDSLNQIAAAGGTTSAIPVDAPDQLVPALTGIINKAIRTESCDGADNDCDGKVDEDFPGLGTLCDDHKKGVCRSEGMIACNASKDGTTCKYTSTGTEEGTESCNDLDDDCDGAIDEGLDCQMQCEDKKEETCNGKDDDCDGKVDESDPMLNKSCGQNQGQCLPGYWRCILGAPICVGATLPQPEQCNGRDDDCDGVIDDDAPCPDPTRCIEGSCRNPCGQSEFSCPVGQLCELVNNPAGAYCVPRACALCKLNEDCSDDDTCVDLCEGVNCPDNSTCVRGVCRDCTIAGCTGGRVCFDKVCQDNPCANVTCGDQELCFNGTCKRVCEDAGCPDGQKCNAEGICAANPCRGVTCEPGETCRDGECVENRCDSLGGLCGSGDVCAPYVGCVSNPCNLTTCPAGTVCAVAATGEPVCASASGAPVKSVSPSYVSTGGSGLTSCSVGQVGAGTGASGWFAGLLLLGLVGLRRSRQRQRAWLALSALLFGCESSAICLDCAKFDGGANGRLDGGGSGDDSGNPYGGPYDGDGGSDWVNGDAATSLTCTNLGEEVCNHLDDDCDKRVDEDFDFSTNVRHCGACNQPCVADNALAECRNGECVVGACAAGYVDIDDKQPGCEYRCPVFPTSLEDCNGLDDDCDGKIDEELVTPDPATRCRHTAGTPCAGVKLACKKRDTTTTWFCEFPDTVDFDPSIPDGALAPEETRCDGQDNDCDGVVDEPWPTLGDPCDDGKIGACRNGGAVACTSDKKNAACDLSLPPDPLAGAGPDAPELCNDLDDNCDGIVDNPMYDANNVLDEHRVKDEMVKIPGRNVWIYKYEASRPDATDDNAGVAPARACSRAGVLPWSYVSYTQASAACAATSGGSAAPQKKRLCTADEWRIACENGSVPAAGTEKYPYGASYADNTCNGADHDTDSAMGGVNNAVLPTGSMAQCVTPGDGVFDLSGNLKEWTSQLGAGNESNAASRPANENNWVVRGGSYESPRLGLTCETTLSQAVGASVLSGVGFRCCSDVAP